MAVDWSVDEENLLVVRYERSLQALALQNGQAMNDALARSIAVGQALATLHLRAANEAIMEIAKADRHGPRAEVTAFAEAMELKLKKKEPEYGRRGWTGMAPEAFRATLDAHVAKLWARHAEGKGPDQLLSDAADIANLAMIIALTGRETQGPKT
jgi:hypothetical protein